MHTIALQSLYVGGKLEKKRKQIGITLCGVRLTE